MPTVKKGRTYLKRIIITVIILGAMAYGAFYVWNEYQKMDTTSLFSGEVVCLPLKASPEPPDEATCEKGIKNKDGLYYGVQNVSQSLLILEKNIVIKGTLDPVADGSGDDYAIAGIITGNLVTPRR